MNISEKNITDLPEEVIKHIFQYLPYTDNIAVRLVCKYFYLISTEKLAIKQEVFKITENYLDDGTLSILMNSVRLFTSFKFIKVSFSTELLALFEKYGDTLLHLSVIECDIEENELTNILLKCTNLLSLHLSTCKSLLMPGTIFSMNSPIQNSKLVHLDSLTLEKCGYLTDDIFERFIKVCPNISALNLRGNSISFHSALCKRFYKYSDRITKPTNSVFTIIYIVQILNSIAKQIKCLDFSYTNIDNKSLCSICTIADLNLNKLILTNCTQLSMFFPMEIGKWQSSIVELDISFCDAVTDEVLENICTYMTSLQCLNTSNCKHVSNEGIVHIKNLHNIQKLNISFCMSVTSNSLFQGLENRCSLRELRCRGFRIEENDIILNASCLSNLVFLDLCESYNLCNESLNVLFNMCTQLKTLLLSGCINISDEGLVGIENKHVYSPDSHCGDSQVNNEDIIINNYKKEYSIDNLSNLRILNLEYCSKITCISFQYAMNLPDLRTCNFGGIKITQPSMYHLVKKCPRIESLNLDNCNIDEKTVILAIEKLRRLKYLYLRNCVKLGDATLEAIIQYCQVLKELDVVGCWMMSYKVLDRVLLLPTIQKLSHSLNSVNMLNLSYSIPPAPAIRL